VWSGGVLSQAHDHAFRISQYAVLIEAPVASFVVDYVSVFVQPGYVVAIEVYDSSIFQNSIPGGTILIPDNIDLFFLGLSCRF